MQADLKTASDKTNALSATAQQIAAGAEEGGAAVEEQTATTQQISNAAGVTLGIVEELQSLVKQFRIK
ncbi:hypothetical protein [Sporolituus thermophilus]|uniref:hypothetical protein n=1 Tax=Sporolituus thermophilus TaxID=608505 RepID=UPI00115F83CB|nr:hypothetical protein [Sporolituus thermophilus]